MTRDRMHDAVWHALDSVRDPELDESIVVLGFVASCTVRNDGDVRVVLRLPTFFCAANFAFLMVDDATRALRAVPGTARIDVTLGDHFESEAINAGVSQGRSFVETFGREAHAELDGLRHTFRRKAFLAATDRAVHALQAAGYRLDELVEWTLGEAPELPEVAVLRQRRAEAGLPADGLDPLLVDPDSGRGIGAGDLARHLDRARLTRTSMEANGLLCRHLLRDRYGDTAVGVAVRRSSPIVDPLPERAAQGGDHAASRTVGATTVGLTTWTGSGGP